MSLITGQDKRQHLINWCISRHVETNHLYDGLPYHVHLIMVAQVAEMYKHEINYPFVYEDIIIAAYAHDLIEDTRTTYSDIREMLGDLVANIVYAVTNNKGKNRSERANDSYYLGIVETPGAAYIKLCDRIANVTYSKMVRNEKMYNMYKKENADFIRRLQVNGDTRPWVMNYAPMIKQLELLFS